MASLGLEEMVVAAVAASGDSEEHPRLWCCWSPFIFSVCLAYLFPSLLIALWFSWFCYVYYRFLISLGYFVDYLH